MCKARILSILVSCAFAQEPTCDAGEKCAPDHISLLQTSVSLTDARSHKFMNQSEERDLHVTFHSAEEKRNASRLIMKAIEDAGLSLGEWESTTLPPLPPLTSGTYNVSQKVNMRYLDAYGNSDYNVVTRPAQGDTSQQWVIDAIGDGYYTIKQKWNMRYLDAYGSSHYNVVTRPAQGDKSQKWLIAASGGGYTIRQSMNMRYLDAFEDSAHDYRSVTRTAQNNDSQEWVLTKVTPIDMDKAMQLPFWR